MISVQLADFDHSAEYNLLREKADSDGAIVTFTGLVRDFNVDGSVSGMLIEHYPGMTEKSLSDIVSQAKQRWDLGYVRLIHRVGVIAPCEQIVFVGVSSKHRKNAFEACQFIMDYLKTNAPFWKKEDTANGMEWVKAKESDEKAATRWQKK
ncbi:MAG: molybdopterin synthase catalytic subunit [Alphaproteobacteria bacterium]|jgi:molybdopterin synthase catalytic subunit